jgi:hypothetical protein
MKRVFAVLAFLSLSSCGEVKVNNGTTNAGSKSLTAAGATIDTPSTVALSGGYLALKNASTATVGCKIVPGVDTASSSVAIEDTAIDYQISSTTKYQAQAFTTSSYMSVSAVTVAIVKTGGPATVLAEIRSTSSGSPTAPVVGTSNSGNISTLEDPDYGNVTMSLTSTTELTGGQTYAIVVKPVTGTYDASNKAAFMTTPSLASACSGFADYKNSSNSGSTWAAGTLSSAKGVFNVTVATHSPSGTASWIAIGTANGTWNMSTFTFSENPRTITTGTITYDVGAGNDAATPTYSNTGLTKAQVQALSNLSGQYFYVRANLAVSAPYYDQAELGDGSISAN